MPSAAVARDEIVEVLGRDRPAAADVRVVGGNVGEALRRAVRHQDHRGPFNAAGSDTRLHSRGPDELGEPRDRSGSVRGRTPWPRLKMWPGRPPARSSTSRAAASTRSHGPSSTAGIEVALHAAVLADELPAVVERRCASRARSRRRPRASSRAAASTRRCRSGSSARRRRRGCAPTRARRTPRSRPARARRPTSRRAG